jgi:hypothetical protein
VCAIPVATPPDQHGIAAHVRSDTTLPNTGDFNMKDRSFETASDAVDSANHNQSAPKVTFAQNLILTSKVLAIAAAIFGSLWAAETWIFVQ